jgi:2-dehydropantoate 2-reductase
MKIYMIGAGAMGGVYGGLLTRAGYDVTLVDLREDHIGKIRSEGITIEGVRGMHVIKLTAQSSHAGLPPGDLAIIFTDSNSTRDAAKAARHILKPDGFALTLQNGIGNVEALVEELGRERVIAGVSMNSAANPAAGRSA